MLNLFDPASTALGDKCIKKRYSFVAIALLVILILILYLPTLKWLVQIWSKDEQFAHGFFVPVISLYLVWLKQDWLKQLAPKPAVFWGGLMVFGAISILLVGRCGSFMQAEGISLLFFLPGVVLFLLGSEILKALSMPLFYLQFMVPWLDPVFEKIQPIFQYISASIATPMLRLRYPVMTDGFEIHLPHISMVVARECSGINFIFSILAIGLPLVYITQKTWTRAFVVLFIGCLISILSNGVRVAIAGVMGEEFGLAMLHGPAHIFEGWFVAWVGWISLFVANWIFKKIPYKNGEPPYQLYERSRKNKESSDFVSNNDTAVRLPFYTLFALLLGFTIYLNFFAMPKIVALNTPLRQFPAEINGWQGVQNDWFAGNQFFPELDNKLSRAYHDESGNVVYVFIGYYQRQDSNKRLVSYLSRPLHKNAETINLPKDHSSFQAVSASLADNSIPLTTLFWYQFPDKLKMTDRLRVKLHVLKSGILQRKNNGAIILLAMAKEPVKDSDINSFKTFQSFAADLAPIIDQFLH